MTRLRKKCKDEVNGVKRGGWIMDKNGLTFHDNGFVSSWLC